MHLTRYSEICQAVDHAVYYLCRLFVKFILWKKCFKFKINYVSLQNTRENYYRHLQHSQLTVCPLRTSGKTYSSRLQHSQLTLYPSEHQGKPITAIFNTRS